MSDVPPPNQPPGDQPPAGGFPPPQDGSVPPAAEQPPAGGFPPPTQGPGTPPPPGGGFPPPGNGYPPPPAGGFPPPSGSGLDVGAGFSWAWKKFQENAAALVVSTLIMGLLGAALYLVVFLPFALTTGPSFDAETGEYDAGPGFFLRLVVMALALFLGSIVAQTLASNLVRMVLDVADGAKPSIGDLFAFRRGFGPAFVTALLLAAGTSVGILLCYLPGLLFAWGSAFTFYFFHDRGLSPVDSIKASFKFFVDNIGPAIVIVLLAGLVSSAGLIVCCIGVLVSAPVAQLFTAHQFRSVAGGSIAP